MRQRQTQHENPWTGPPPRIPASLQSATLGLLNRRDLLRVGSLGLAATALPAALTRSLAALEVQGELSAAQVRGKADAVIVLWMAGGVTHIDSFDPKPHAPQEIRGTLGDIATSLTGVRFCETMPAMAGAADKIALVRSYSHDSDDHLISQVFTLSGKRVNMSQLYSEPNIGSVVSHLCGPRRGLPGYIAVPGITRPGPPPYNLFVGGWLGSRFVPYALGGLPAEPDFTVGEKLWDPPADIEEDLQPRSLKLPDEIPLARLGNRAELRQSLDQALGRLEREDALLAADEQYHSALRLLQTPEVRDAFDFAGEPERVREAYGRTKLGGRCLVARRLVEAGARFVLVDYGYDPDYGNVWDNHNAPSQNHPPIQEMCRRGYHLAGMDRAFAALITDLAERGMLERTLVVFLTEFGRTPRINPQGGRDHWGAAGSIFFAGGGTKAGQVIGATDDHAAAPTTHPYTPADVAATMYAALGIDPATMVYDVLDRPRPILDEGRVMSELF
jgi:hypothetical protein